MSLSLDPNYVWRDFELDGVPSSGKHDPRKPDIRALLTQWWQVLIALAAEADPELELPNLLIRFSLASSNINTLVVEPNLEIPDGPGLALFSLTIANPNTGNMSLSIPFVHGPKPLRTSTGNEIPPGGVQPGTYLLLDNGSDYRLISYASMQAINEALRDQSVAAKNAAEAARDIAAGYASDAVSQGNVPIYATAVGMSALNVPPGINALRTNGYYAAGDMGGALYKRVGAEPAHIGKLQSSDGAWWEIVPENDTLMPTQLGAKGDGVGTATDNDTPYFEAAIALASRVLIPEGVFIVRNWFMTGYSNKTIEGVGWGAVMRHPAMDLEGSASVIFRPRDGENIFIRNFAMDGNRDNVLNGELGNTEVLDPNNVTNCQVSGMLLMNAVAEGYDIDDGTDSFIENSLILNCGGNAAHISSGCVRVFTRRCIAINCGLNGIRAAFDCFEGGGPVGSRDSGIEDCVAIDCYRGFVISGKNNSIRNCTDYRSEATAFAFAGTGGFHTIENIRSYDSGGTAVNIQVPCTINGIYVNGAFATPGTPITNAGVVFTANATACTGSNIEVRNTIGAGVTITSNSNTLSTITTDQTGGNGVVVNGNSNNLTGILSRFSSSAGVHITGQDNTLTGVSTFNADGVGFSIASSASRTNATGIYTANTGGSGIADLGPNSNISNARTVSNAGGHGLTTNTAGGDYSNIRSHSSANDAFNITGSQNTLTSCRAMNASSTGFRIVSGSDNYLIGCRSTGHGAAALNDGGTGTVATPNL